MALYAIGDLHLSLGSDKPMDVFGGAWVGYVDKLREGLSVIGPARGPVLGAGPERRARGFCHDRRHSGAEDHRQGKS